MGHPEMHIISPGKSLEKGTKNKPSNGKLNRDNDNVENKIFEDSLDFQYKHLTVFPLSDIASNGVYITHVNINYNKISQLPEQVSLYVPHLQTFTANGNELSHLPDNFGELFHLQELCLCENKLVLLPESLSKLTKLRRLKVNANCLKRLHTEIGQNISLEALSVNDNMLKRLPATFGLLRNLHVFEANSNQLTTLPSTLNYLESLKVVNLSNNRLTDIPESFGDLKNLTHIDLSENKIGHLCKQFQSIKTLQQLYLDINIFTKCPEWFKDLENVVEIRMKCNQLSGLALPEEFGLYLRKLKILDLRGNFIQELPKKFGHLTSIESLLLGTPLNCLEKNSHFQNGNWLSILPYNFAELISLTNLHLEENQLRTLPEDIGKLIHLEDFFLGSNMLVELPASFTNLVALRRCQLSKNRLMKLPEDFGALKLLTDLHLDFNKLRTLPSSMRNLTNLKMINLSGNKLKQVPSDIMPAFIRLTALNLRDVYCPKSPEEAGSSNSSSKFLEVEDNDLDEDRVEEVDTFSFSSSSADRSFNQLDLEENWDEDSEHTNNGYIHEGQFDLDDEEPVRQSFIPATVRFDCYGICSSVVYIQNHCSAPYIYHAPMISRFLYEPDSTISGQFDDDGSNSDNVISTGISPGTSLFCRTGIASACTVKVEYT